MSTQGKIRTYSDLIQLSTFHERFAYLALYGKVGHTTFGPERYLNQNFYRSKAWKRVRTEVIARDNGCDLGIAGREIYDKIYVHHMNPLYIEDFEDNYDLLLNPEFLISMSYVTHQAITFGTKNNLLFLPRERTKGDTKLW